MFENCYPQNKAEYEANYIYPFKFCYWQVFIYNLSWVVFKLNLITTNVSKIQSQSNRHKYLCVGHFNSNQVLQC